MSLPVITAVKIHKGTWLGRKGTSTTYHFDGRRFGKRVNFHVWDDSPELVDIKVLKGNFWRGDGTEKMYFELNAQPIPTGSYGILAENLAGMWLK